MTMICIPKECFNRIFFKMLKYLNYDLEELLARERKGVIKEKREKLGVVYLSRLQRVSSSPECVERG